jgi:SpoVK/Ycf46/Vps4 family AAA+-type ATPase
MLLSGPPGTGKSAYARYVAAACGLEVLEKKASDLLDMFVGGTERAIARVFEEATEIGALLIFDEADSMLRNRRLADRGWEVSMVNEMLSWMDQHPMPFVATTNLCDTLDRATSRRFLFKLKFEYLDAARSVSLFERTFGKRAPKSLDLLDELTPADFEVVARRASLLGVTNEAVLIAMLQSELEARSNGLHRTIGFARYGVTSNRQ